MDFIQQFIDMINKFIEYIKELVKNIRDINDGKGKDDSEAEA